MSRPRGLSWAVFIALAALATWWVLGTVQPGQPEPRSTTASTASSGLPVVTVSELPPEASVLLELIDTNGPFAEEQDGGTFQNREEILPDQPPGYYREYTVPTPGSADRGARRIVTGDSGEFYWTSDHYRTFSRIKR